MRGTRDRRKGRRHGQDLGPGLRQTPVERGKADVVADRQPEHAPGCLGQHRAVAGAKAVGFAVGFLGRDIHVEHVDLVVARADVAIGADQEGPVGEAPVGVVGQQRERADQQPDAVLRRRRRQIGSVGSVASGCSTDF